MPKFDPKFRLSNVKLDEVSLVPSGDDKMAAIVLSKADPEHKYDSDGIPSPILPNNQPGGSRMGQESLINKDDLDPEVRAYVDALEDALLSKDDDDEEYEDEGTDEDEGEEEEAPSVEKSTKKGARQPVAKSDKDVLAKADPALRALIEKRDREIAELREQASEAMEVAKSEQFAREQREFISKAEQLSYIPTNSRELGGLLHSLSKKAPDEYKAVEKLLRAANAQIQQGNLFTEFGKSGAESETGSSIAGMAAELRKSDPKMSMEQAEAQVLAQHPELYEQYLRESTGR